MNDRLIKLIYCSFIIFIAMAGKRKQGSQRWDDIRRRKGSHFSKSSKQQRAAQLAEARRKKAAIREGQGVPGQVIPGDQAPASPEDHGIPDESTPVMLFLLKGCHFKYDQPPFPC